MKKIIILNCLLCPCCTFLYAQESKEGYKEINGASLYYRMVESGESLLIIHGGPGLDQGYLREPLKKLSARYKLFFYDQRLSGKSSAVADTNTISLDGFLNDIEGLRKELKLNKINILAHSFGSLFALNYAAQYPKNVKSLILVSSVSPDSKDNVQAEKELSSTLTSADSAERRAIVTSKEFNAHEVSAFNKLIKFGLRHQLFTPDYIDSLKIDLPIDYYERGKLLQHLRKSMGHYDYFENVKTIKCPVLLIYGVSDPLYQIAAPKMKNSLQNVKLVVISKSGHFPFVENKKEFYDAILNWHF
jgi:proline iminopeptidase